MATHSSLAWRIPQTGAWRATVQRVTELDTNERLSTMYIANTHLKKKKPTRPNRTVHPTEAEDMLFLSACGTFSRRDHVLDCKTSLNKKKVEIIQRI